MKARLKVCGPTGLVMPAPRATRRTMRAAPWRSRRSPSGPRNSGPSLLSPMARSMARAVRGASGTVTTLPPLRRMVRARWAALQSERLNVGPSGFGDPEPVQGEQENEGVLGGGAEAGGHEQRSDFVAVKSGGVRLVVDSGAPHVHCRRVVQELLLHGVAACGYPNSSTRQNAKDRAGLVGSRVTAPTGEQSHGGSPCHSRSQLSPAPTVRNIQEVPAIRSLPSA